MSDDEMLPDGVPGFDDPDYDDLRRLLADARVTAPLPADVAARLDEALAGLGPDRPLDRTVVPLRRPRRTGSRLLVAAAVLGAVAVGGVGLSQVLQQRSSDSDSGLSSADSGAAAGSTGGGSSGPASEVVPGAADLAALPALSSASFEADAARYVDRVEAATGYQREDAGSPAPVAPQAESDAKSADSLARELAALRASGCTPATSGRRQETYAILLDGRPAVLSVLTNPDGSRSVQALSCTGEVLAEAVLD